MLKCCLVVILCWIASVYANDGVLTLTASEPARIHFIVSLLSSVTIVDVAGSFVKDGLTLFFDAKLRKLELKDSQGDRIVFADHHNANNHTTITMFGGNVCPSW